MSTSREQRGLTGDAESDGNFHPHSLLQEHEWVQVPLPALCSCLGAPLPLRQQNKGGATGRTTSTGHGRSAVPTRPPARCHPPARAAHRDASGAEKRSAPCRPWPRPRPRQRSREPDGSDAWGGGVKGRAVAAAVPLSPRRSQTRRSPARSRLAVRAQPGHGARAAREEVRGRAAPPGPVAWPRPPNRSVTPRAPCGGRGTFVTQRAARGRRGTADSAPRVPPRSPDGKR